MKLLDKKYLTPLLFLIIGGCLGYLYYLKIGCVTGTCGITSNPFFSTIYGGVFGVLLFMLLPSKNQTIRAIADAKNSVDIDRKGE